MESHSDGATLMEKGTFISVTTDVTIASYVQYLMIVVVVFPQTQFNQPPVRLAVIHSPFSCLFLEPLVTTIKL